MLLIVSLLMVLGYSLYLFFDSSSKNQKVTRSFSKCIPMLLGMTSSLMIGLVIALFMPQSFALSTILSIALSAIIAFLIGARFGVNGIIEAQAASLMGATMGAMQGVMLASDEMMIMVMAMDFIYLGSIITTRILIDKRLNILNKKTIPFYSSLLFSICLIVGTGLLHMDSPKKDASVVEETHNHQH